MPKQALEGRQIQARSDDFLSPLPGLAIYPIRTHRPRCGLPAIAPPAPRKSFATLGFGHGFTGVVSKKRITLSP